jgi:hypothetical protein
VIALLALAGLAVAALNFFGVIDLTRLFGNGGGQPPGISAQLPSGQEPVSGVVAVLPPTETSTTTPSATPTQEPATETPAAPVAVLVQETPTQQPSPTETSLPTAPKPRSDPIGGGPGQVAFASDRAEPGILRSGLPTSMGPIPSSDKPPGWSLPARLEPGWRYGLRLSLQENYDRYLNSALYLINADGSGERQLSDGIGGDYDPCLGSSTLSCLYRNAQYR